MWKLSVFIVASTFSFVAGNSTGTTCDIRYDLRFGVAKELFERTAFKEYAKPICKTTLKILYFDSPPYTYTLKNGGLDGILPAILKIILGVCCFNHTQLSHQKPLKDVNQLYDIHRNKSYYDIIMPVIGLKDAKTYLGNPLVSLMRNPGVAYISVDNTEDVVADKCLKTVLDAAPLFFCMLLLTIDGGVIIWLLDSRKNKEDFSPSFIRGSLEGSWWAYVSMTTVGYGDKSPRSFAGRLFAVVWITLGIVITGIFTASMSSALTSAVMGDKTSLDGKNIGFLKKLTYGFEENIIYKEGGKARGCGNISELIHLWKNGTINGIMMDTLTLRYHLKELNDGMNKKLAIKRNIATTDVNFGMIFSYPGLNNWAEFLRDFIAKNADVEHRLLHDAIQKMEEKVLSELPKNSELENGMFGSPSIREKVYILLCVCCGTTIFVGLATTGLHKLYKTKKSKQRQANDAEMSVFKDGIATEKLEDYFKAFENAVLVNLRDQTAQLRDEIFKKQTFTNFRK